MDDGLRGGDDLLMDEDDLGAFYACALCGSWMCVLLIVNSHCHAWVTFRK